MNPSDPDPSSLALHTLADRACLVLTLPALGDGRVLFALWHAWRAARPKNSSRLHLRITSDQPIPLAALQPQPADTPLYTLLAHQYPPAIAGIHRLIFADERLTLDLCIGVEAALHPAAQTIPPDSTDALVVIGAGIAGLSMAHALALRGHRVTLIEQTAPLAGGSGNPRALLLSKLPKLARVAHNLQTQGGLSTARWWQAWADDVVTATGALLLASPDEFAQAADYPSALAERLDPAAVHAVSGMTSTAHHLSLPAAAVLNPLALRDRVLASPLIRLVQGTVSRLLPQDGAGWQIMGNEDAVIATAQQVIVAAAKDSTRLCPTLPPLTVIRGQMSWCAASTDRPRVALGYGGYAVRFDQQVLLGSSFVRDDTSTALREGEHQVCYELLHSAYPDYAQTLPDVAAWQGRASLRALPRDSMPLVGAVPEMTGVYALTGLGSKGFSFAPLCAEALASQILGEPLPLPAPLMAQINPARFIKTPRVRKPYYTPPQ